MIARRDFYFFPRNCSRAAGIIAMAVGSIGLVVFLAQMFAGVELAAGAFLPGIVESAAFTGVGLTLILSWEDRFRNYRRVVVGSGALGVTMMGLLLVWIYPASALGFIFAGLALFFLLKDNTAAIFQIFSILVVFVGLFMIMDHMLPTSAVGNIAGSNPAGIVTGIGLILLGAGILFTSRNGSLTRMAVSDGAAGLMVRRLLPAALLGPTLLGAILAQGHRWELYDLGSGHILLVLLVSAISVGIVLWASYLFKGFAHDDRIRHDSKEQHLESARDKALDSLESKSRFLANMSHELRTPLTSIIGAADILADSQMDRRSRQWLEVMSRGGHALLAIIGDILDISKIESGQFKIVEVNFYLKDAMESIVKLIGIQAHAKSLEISHKIEPDVPDEIRGDPARLRQVLLNLSSNAVKFTKKGKVALSVSCQFNTRETAELVFTVSDTGIGIPAGMLEKVFDRFVQADLTIAHQYGGTGLGLAISRKIVELMGGTIWAQSEEGRGSTFSFRLPLKKWIGLTPNTPAADNFANSKDSYKLKPLKILLAEDSLNIRDLVKEYLKDLPYFLETAENGRLAYQQFRERRFDLVLMDMRMPVLDGLSSTRLIRLWEAKEGRPPVPIVAFTAFSLEEEIQASLAAGCTHHVSKPIRQEPFLETILQATVARNAS